MNARQARDPAPVARQGEAALLALAGLTLVCSWAAVAGVALATFLTCGSWMWPADSATTVQILRGLLTGHPDQGWTPAQTSHLPGTFLIYGGAALAELAALACVAACIWVAMRLRLPNDGRRGLASRREASHVLGLARLRKVTPVIRPDLAHTEAPRRTPPRARVTDAPARRGGAR